MQSSRTELFSGSAPECSQTLRKNCINSIIIENVASVGGSSFFVDVHDPFTCARDAVLVFFVLASGEGVIGVGMTSTRDAVVCFAMDSGSE